MFASLAPACLASAAIAAEPPAGERYHLFNPKPPELRRPLSPDRPDTTESPHTVDAGAVQLEMSFFDYARNGDEETLVAAPLNLKLGLLEHTDLQFVFDPYIHVDGPGGSTRDGVGDVTLRLKQNLWGNDEGATAFAVMPFIKLPIASGGIGNDHVEGGLILPLATSVGSGLALGLMLEIDFVYDEFDDAYDLELLHTAAAGFELTDRIGLYVEYIGVAAEADGDYRMQIGSGATYSLSDDVVLDCGVNVGLHGNADDFNVFSGITVRF